VTALVLASFGFPRATSASSDLAATGVATLVREPYLQQVTPTGAVIAWATREQGAAEVRYRTPGGTATSVPAVSTLFSAAMTGMADDYYQHVATITGLAASTLYEYDILVSGTDLNLQSDSFRTAPAVGTGPVSFVALGDSGTGSPEQQHIDALIESESFDFALHSGDLAYGAADGTGTGTFQTTNDWFFSVYRNWLRSRPVYPVNGNHDSRAANGNGLPYLGLFVLPTNGATDAYPDHAERYYSFDYGPIHVVALDTEYAFLDSSRRSAQLAWLRADLAATKQPWKIALFHRPPYSAGGEHGSSLDVRAAFDPIFEQFGVQVAIGGHEHDYERTVLLRAGTLDPTGVTYIVTGGGGAPLYASSTASWTAYSATRFHYLRGSADTCTLQIKAVGDDGSVFDSVSLDRCAQPADTAPPTVSIPSPTGGASVRGVTTVTVGATDNVGVADVQLMVDGVSVGHDGAAPFAFSWDTTGVTNGTHTLQASATDAAGNTSTSAAVAVTVSNPVAGSDDIVLYAADVPASSIFGKWVRVTDATAAGGARLRNPNAGAAKRTSALAVPVDYFEMSFTAPAGVPYHLWVRGKADSDNYANDSVFVQFSDSTANRIGTTGAAEMNLEDCSGCGVTGWGWQDNGYGVNVFGPNITFAASGVHTLRIQTREDGLSIDQVMLSCGKFLTAAPGSLKKDTTIYPPNAGGALPPADTEDPVATIVDPASGSTLTGVVTLSVQATDNVGVTRVELMVGATSLGNSASTSTPYSFRWDTSTMPNGTYTLQAHAWDAAGHEGASPPLTITVANSAPVQPLTIVLYTADAPAGSVFGKWKREADATAAGGARLRHPDAGAAKRTTALAAPADYFEMTLTAEANVPYHLWMRARGDSNYWANDSVFVQFTKVNGALIGTTAAMEMNLEDCSGCGIAGWGWQDNGYGIVGPDFVFSERGTQTIRVQTREDGIAIDQIVLSPAANRRTPPGALKNDATIVAR
jgi:hypothetical protein